MQTREEVLKYLKAKRAGLMEQLEELDATIEHLSATIDMIEKEIIAQAALAQRTVEPGPEIAEFPVGRLRSLTQLQAVIAIAKHYGGTVRAQDAKRLMIRAGVMRETKNSTNITHNVIIRSHAFDRVGPGEYRLKPVSKTEGGKEFYASPVQ